MAEPVPAVKVDSAVFIREHYQQIQANRISFTTFSAKIDVNYKDNKDKKYNVNAHLRMYKDSVIWISVTAILGIEAMRAYITKDSVKILDKDNKVLLLRTVSYLRDMTALPLDLPSLQELLIGNPVFLDSNIVSYTKASNDISFFSIGTFFKNLFTISENEKWPLSSKLDDVDEQRNRTCLLTYSNYENKQGFLFSTRRSISLSEKGKTDIKMDFKQYSFNETLSFPFSIPKNYTIN